MRRLTFPVVMPYDLFDWGVGFAANREALCPMGEPGFIEDDPYRTASGREFFWAFEVDGGVRFQVRWSEPLQAATVVADPPAPRQVVNALRSMGMAVAFETRELPEEKRLRKAHAQGAVWIFTGNGAAQATAVFTRKALADQWLERNRFSGQLVAYPLDVSIHDAEKNWEPQALPVLSAEEVQRYVGSFGERYTYRDGRLVHPGSIGSHETRD